MDYFIHPIRLNTSESHNIWFISDTHFGHAKEFLYGKRGFKNVLEHDATIINSWNNVVGDNDTVIHCGDFMFGEGGLERILNYFDNLKFGTLYLMPGNHHAGLKQFFAANGANLYEVRLNKFVRVVPNYTEFVVNHQPIVACHYPIASWNGMGKGVWCVSGHCHGSYAGSQLDNTDGKILDVGIEVIGNAPIDFQRLHDIMDKKTIKIVDHHNSSTSTSLH